MQFTSSTAAPPGAASTANDSFAFGPTTTYMDMAVDTADLGNVYPSSNFSSTLAPAPEAMVEPPPLPRTFVVVTAGENVGIFDESSPNQFDPSQILSLPFFAMEKFTGWKPALDFYTKKYHEGEIRLSSTVRYHPPAQAVPAAPIAPSVTPTLAPTISATLAPSVSTTKASVTIPAPPSVPAPATNMAAAPPPPSVSAPATNMAAAPPPPSDTAPGPSGANLAIDFHPIRIFSPFSDANQPIDVTSAFPTPDFQSGSKKHPFAVVDSPGDKSSSGSVSRHAKTIRAARVTPTFKKQPPQSDFTIKKVVLTNSRAATRVKLSKGKGKGKGKGKAVERPNIVVYGDSDDSDAIPGPSYPKAPRATEGGQTTRIEPLVYQQADLSTNAPMFPAITVTPATPAAPIVAATTASAPIGSDDPFLTSPTRTILTNTRLPATPPAPPTAAEEFELLVQEASQTPKLTGSQRRLELIKEALSSPSPPPSPSEKRLAIIQAALSQKFGARQHTPGLPPTSERLHQIVYQCFETSPVGRTPSHASATVSTPTQRFIHGHSTLNTPSIIHGPSTFATPSTPRTTGSAINNQTSGAVDSPETDYGLSDMEPGFLDAAKAHLDQKYVNPDKAKK